MDLWAYQNGVKIDFSWPGKPIDNAYVESFNSSFRDECLNVNCFLSPEDARGKIEPWLRHYYENRPHPALGNMRPSEFDHRGGASRALVGFAKPGSFTPQVDLKRGNLQNSGKLTLDFGAKELARPTSKFSLTSLVAKNRGQVKTTTKVGQP